MPRRKNDSPFPGSNTLLVLAPLFREFSKSLEII